MGEGLFRTVIQSGTRLHRQHFSSLLLTDTTGGISVANMQGYLGGFVCVWGGLFLVVRDWCQWTWWSHWTMWAVCRVFRCKMFLHAVSKQRRCYSSDVRIRLVTRRLLCEQDCRQRRPVFIVEMDQRPPRHQGASAVALLDNMFLWV